MRAKKSDLTSIGQLLLEDNASSSGLKAIAPLKITKPKQQFIENIVAIKEEPEAYDKSFLARNLVLCTLPHKDPGEVPSWERRNGKIHLGSLQDGISSRNAPLVFHTEHIRDFCCTGSLPKPDVHKVKLCFSEPAIPPLYEESDSTIEPGVE